MKKVLFKKMPYLPSASYIIKELKFKKFNSGIEYSLSDEEYRILSEKYGHTFVDVVEVEKPKPATKKKLVEQKDKMLKEEDSETKFFDDLMG